MEYLLAIGPITIQAAEPAKLLCVFGGLPGSLPEEVTENLKGFINLCGVLCVSNATTATARLRYRRCDAGNHDWLVVFSCADSAVLRTGVCAYWRLWCLLPKNTE